MAPPYVDAARLREALSCADAVDALERAFREEDVGATPQRINLPVPGGELLQMPAFGRTGVGVKLVTLNPSNPARDLPFIHGVYVLFHPDTLRPLAMIDGAALTAVRTAAVSALATRVLARADARRLVLFGAGTQAEAHAEAIAAVRPIERVTVVGRSRDRAEALARRIREQGLEAGVGRPDAVRDADVVCTCTTSAEPVFRAADLAAGAHVNAVGSYRLDRRELEPALLARALVVVETIEAAIEEAGDLVWAMQEGAVTRDAIVELADVVRGRVGRTTAGETTVFKSVGLAIEDLAVASAAALALGLESSI
jgi:ornithine cyclodeaminase